MGRTACTLGSAPAAVAEGSAASEPAEGPAAGGVGPWLTRDLKE